MTSATTASTSPPSSASPRAPLGALAAALCTTVADGDMHPERAGEARRRAILDQRWCFVHQVHGSTVLVASRTASRREGDALVTDDDALALALLGADCALLAMASPEGVRAVAHVGWRGLMAGVVAETARAMRSLGATEIVARRSPTIHAECYAFSPADLAPIVSRFGAQVASTTRGGSPALDLPAALSIDCGRAGLTLREELAGCTACDARFYSWRARREHARHALVCFVEGP